MLIRFMDERRRADSQLAEVLSRAYVAVGDNAKDVWKHLYLGVERITWYSSCFFDDYQGICHQLRRQDYNELQSILHGYQRSDVCALVFTLFIEYLLLPLSEADVRAVMQKIKNDLHIDLMQRAALIASGSVAKKTVAYSIASAVITRRPGINIYKTVSRRAMLLTVIEHYGILQERTKCARKLWRTDYVFHDILASNRVETFWFYVEPVLGKYLTAPRKKEQDVYKIISELLRY
ncbi:hypothetical protein C7M52_00055 [Mixta theicola]|nr:hypothetical protein C7M52_00055 [Mixta theicola]